MIVTKEPQAMVIQPKGETLTASNAKDFKAAIEEYLDSQQNILLDLSNITFIDSSGLGVFLFCLKRLNQKQGELKLCNITKPVRVLFELVRLHQVIEIFNSREEALASFTSS